MLHQKTNPSFVTLKAERLALLIFFLFSGCTFIPHYSRPALPVPSQFPYVKGKTPSTLANEIGWQDFFKDPRLQRMIELALNNNRDYRTALLNVEQIRAQYRIIQYAFLPSFELDASGTRERQFVKNDSYNKARSYKASVNTAYEVDIFGHIRSLRAQVLEQYMATQEASRSAQITLVSEVAVQYLTERAFAQQLDLARQTLSSVQAYYALITKSYQLGNSSALDLRLAQTQVQTALVAIDQYERLLAQTDDALALLIGQPLPADLPPARELSGLDLIQDIPVGLSSDLLEQRPDILEAEHQLKAANANIGAVRAAFFPVITLTASDGTASAKLTKLFTTGTQVWNFSPQISLPLFNQNTNLANLDAAQVGKNIQIAQYEKAVQNAFKEVSDAIIARDTYNAQVGAQRGLVHAQKARFELTSARYHNGIDSYLTVLLAQQDLYNAQVNLIQVSLERFTNLISLYKALGGGWKK